MNILLAAASLLAATLRRAAPRVQCCAKPVEPVAKYRPCIWWLRRGSAKLARSFGALQSDPRLTVPHSGYGAWRNPQEPLVLPANCRCWHRRSGADVVHLAYPVPLNSGAFACPIVVTLHDLYPHEIPENFWLPQGDL
jgi:hypothetical protein